MQKIKIENTELQKELGLMERELRRYKRLCNKENITVGNGDSEVRKQFGDHLDIDIDIHFDTDIDIHKRYCNHQNTGVCGYACL